MNIFYVYALLDPRKKGSFQYGNYTFEYEPFYIGKGKGNRCKNHLGQIRGSDKEKTFKANKMRKIFEDVGLEPIIIKIFENLSEDLAFEKEKSLIALIGRCDRKKGPLTNLTDGGDGLSGLVFTEEMKCHMSAARRNLSDKTREKMILAHTGKKHSEETKKKISLSQIGQSSFMFGKHLSETTKKKISLTLSEKKPFLGKHHTEEARQKISLKNSGENHFNFGKTLSEETKEKMKASQKRRRDLEKLILGGAV